MGKLSTDKTSAARLLTGVADLAAALAAEHPPVVLDVRWRLGGPPGLDSYQAGHVPGAAFADLDQDLAAPAGSGGRHPLPETGVFQAAMRRAGISQASPVVVYDDGDSTVAARAWWLLRYFGHGRVRVLDGGFRAWTQAGQPVSTEVPQPRLGSFTARPGGMPLLSAAAAARLARSGVCPALAGPCPTARTCIRPLTVTRCFGLVGSASRYRRSRTMKLSIARVSVSSCRSQTSSRIDFLETALPAFFERYCSRSHSICVS